MGPIEIHSVIACVRCGLALLVLAWLARTAEAQTKFSPAHRYPGPWLEISQTIRDVLDLRNVTACTQAMRRQSSHDTGEYLLYCTRDGQHWTRWRVRPAAQKLRGPGEVFEDIPPPRN